jgi:hypothetical protein
LNYIFKTLAHFPPLKKRSGSQTLYQYSLNPKQKFA